MFHLISDWLKNSRCSYLVFFILASQVLNSCTQHDTPATSSRVIAMTTDLVQDSTIYRIYDSLHSNRGVWPELKKANMASGIREIKIYRFDNRLMMLLVLSDEADLSKMDSLYVNSDKKIRLWGEMMSRFQKALPGMDSSAKWVEMKLVHHYLDGEYLK